MLRDFRMIRKISATLIMEGVVGSHSCSNFGKGRKYDQWTSEQNWQKDLTGYFMKVRREVMNVNFLRPGISMKKS